MNDVVLLQIINSGFWLLLFSATILFFRKEIRKLLQSLGSFKVAGSSFEFNDPKETIKSYILLAETLIDMLSRSNKIREIEYILVPTQVEKLSAFAITYTQEVSREAWNEELLINIAYLLLRFERYSLSVTLCDALLGSRVSNAHLLNTKALAMINSRLQDQVVIASSILSDLVDRYPENSTYRYNYALAQSLSGEHEVALDEMKKIIETDFIENNNYILQDYLFHRTVDARPDEVKKLTERLKSRLKKPV